jgi:hypothetical protein
MKLKHALWATAVWTVVALGVSIALIGYMSAHPVPGASLERRSAALGEGVAVGLTLGYGLIWLPYAVRLGKQRREAQRQKHRKKPQRAAER